MIAGVALVLWASTSSAPAAALSDPAARGERGITVLRVPLIRQAPERCGPAALRMVMRYWGASPAAERKADAAYDRALRGALITDLAAAARAAGYGATIRSPGEDTLATLFKQGTPPILLIDSGVGPVHKGHYVVLVEWDEVGDRVTVHDGGSRPRSMRREELMKRWRSAGGQALLVWPG